MLEIAAIITPIFLLIGVGFMAMRLSILSYEQMQGVGRFVLYIALPALLIRAITQNPLEEVFNVTYLLAYGLGSLGVFGLALGYTVMLKKQPLTTGSISALGMSVSNSAFSGYPVAVMIIGPPAANFLALNMLIENLLIIPLALILAEAGSQAGRGVMKSLQKTLKQLAKNPILIGLFIGVLIAITDIHLPKPVTQAIDMLATAAGPAALFAIGGTLYGLKIRGVMGEVSQIVTGKLVIHPLGVLICMWLIADNDALLTAGALLFASAPMASIYPLLGQRYGMGNVAAGTLMAGTLMSFVTISVIVGLMTYFDVLA
ncbi:AEC family transporter [Vreelandella nanhaiensis]|uniref:AEC family transporter n=1 Tax=Vreelandella nanhaiensis TaxID=1258546 RepID=A0A3S0WP50_9GAMM|nr:AEC family transporter [Halomonas nanhaiensis]RUR34286.1 AEC family transporter [Halomonas nanhaiensis]